MVKTVATGNAGSFVTTHNPQKEAKDAPSASNPCISHRRDPPLLTLSHPAPQGRLATPSSCCMTGIQPNREGKHEGRLEMNVRVERQTFSSTQSHWKATPCPQPKHEQSSKHVKHSPITCYCLNKHPRVSTEHSMSNDLPPSLPMLLLPYPRASFLQATGAFQRSLGMLPCKISNCISCIPGRERVFG
jgi:hypothetical protein